MTAILSTVLVSTKPATSVVLFDATSHRNRQPLFGLGVTSGIAARNAAWADRTAEINATCVGMLMDQADLYAMTGETVPMPAYIAEGFVREATTVGYDRHDDADFAAGRLLTAAQLADREEAEEEARLLANCPAEVHEEMLHECEWARPFLA